MRRCCAHALQNRPASSWLRWKKRRTRRLQNARPGEKLHDSLLRRKYVIPFLLACVILFCNTATGINSIIGYNAGILLQSGLSDLHAHWGYVIFTVVNFLMTMVGMMLVDRKGRKFLLIHRHQRHYSSR
jgi:SP family myo-inositol transporter-like MFS transporter 13